MGYNHSVQVWGVVAGSALVQATSQPHTPRVSHSCRYGMHDTLLQRLQLCSVLVSLAQRVQEENAARGDEGCGCAQHVLGGYGCMRRKETPRSRLFLRDVENDGVERRAPELGGLRQRLRRIARAQGQCEADLPRHSLGEPRGQASNDFADL